MTGGHFWRQPSLPRSVTVELRRRSPDGTAGFSTGISCGQSSGANKVAWKYDRLEAYYE